MSVSGREGWVYLGVRSGGCYRAGGGHPGWEAGAWTQSGVVAGEWGEAQGVNGMVRESIDELHVVRGGA